MLLYRNHRISIDIFIPVLGKEESINRIVDYPFIAFPRKKKKSPLFREDKLAITVVLKALAEVVSSSR